MDGTRFHIEINPRLPEALKPLERLANDLWYSWDRPTRRLFARLDFGLWEAVGHNPKLLLHRIDQKKLDAAAQDPAYRGALAQAISAYESYHRTDAAARTTAGDTKDLLVAYFCFEFGLHESLPMYSGGLGILAGDHCKTASDLRIPFVAVGLLYRQGYFSQTIDAAGHQHAIYADTDFEELAIAPVAREDGTELVVGVPLPGREVKAKVWRATAGHVTLYLLDTDIEANNPHDRDIGHRLYGGDRTARIEQELVLGVGGVRALAALGLKPTVWHINEGHAAFLCLERIRSRVREGMDFAAALEATAANTVFTTHTAVPAGHDYFSQEMMRAYFADYCREVGIGIDALLEIGEAREGHEFNMTALAVRCSRYQNGVSRIHGDVSAKICASLWAQVPPVENPVGYVTNGVHVPTFLSDLWNPVLDQALGPGWLGRLTDPQAWKGVIDIPEREFWSVRQSIKVQMLRMLRQNVAKQHKRNQISVSHLERVLRYADPDNPNVLTIGFARRFATYKRATLFAHDLDWLRQIVASADRPVFFVFAGKAHPADEPGRALIRRVAEIAAMREFEGRILLLEGYDLQIARQLVAGVDVWLNNPVYPLEASGTSGMKAAMNGVINLSVLDGWWDEGYDGANGWAIKPASDALDPARRDAEEARSLYEILQDSVVPLYYARGPQGYSPEWVQMCKRSMASIAPRFNSERMMLEYLEGYYRPASQQARRLGDDAGAARALAQWKGKVRQAWPKVKLRKLFDAPRRSAYGDELEFALAVQLDGLAPEDVRVEMLFDRRRGERADRPPHHYALEHRGPMEHGEHRFAIRLRPELCGRVEYRFRAYPKHDLLVHPFELGLMTWL